MIVLFFLFTRKNILWGLIFAVVGISLGMVIKFSPYSKTFLTDDNPCIVIDPGHGIPDGGAVGARGTVEQEINLVISKKLCEVLEGKGMKVIMTRTDENGLFSDGMGIREMKVKDMKKRLEIMKKSDADLFVSIHMNYFPSSKINGLRVFYSANHSEIKPLAEQIQLKMSEITGAKTTAVKTADKTLFLMKNPPIPAILVECGFLSNEEEEKKLNNEDYQSRLAWAIADAIEKYNIK